MTRRQKIQQFRKIHPIRFVSGVAATVQLVTQGLVLFQVWHPTVDQLAYVNSAVVVLAAGWGITAARTADAEN